MLKSLLDAVMANPVLLGSVLGGLLVLGLLVWRFLKRGTDGQAQREAMLRAGVEAVIAFGKPLANATPNTVDDAVIEALIMLDRWLLDQGEPVTSPPEAEVVKAAFLKAVGQ